MSHHDDLLALARRLVDASPAPPEAELRRAVSTAYYALYHRLIDESMRRIVAIPSLRARMSRAFSHTVMKAVATEYRNLKPNSAGELKTVAGEVVSPGVARVADAFVYLQDSRHAADYDLYRGLSRSDAETEVLRAEVAFLDWDSVAAEPSATSFLAELYCRSIPKR